MNKKIKQYIKNANDLDGINDFLEPYLANLLGSKPGIPGGP